MSDCDGTKKTMTEEQEGRAHYIVEVWQGGYMTDVLREVQVNSIYLFPLGEGVDDIRLECDPSSDR